MSTPGQPAQAAAGQDGSGARQGATAARRGESGQQAQQQPATQGGQQPAQQGAQPVAQQGTQPAAQQGTQAGSASRSSRSWSTPRLLRWARAGAAAAALLTGVAATGTFSGDGINATPNVIAQQWASAERAGVEIAHADLRAAERVSGEDGESARSDFDAAVVEVGTDLTSVGASAQGTTGVAQDWSTFVLGAERAVAAASGTEDVEAAATTYDAASQAARSAATATDSAAEQHAEDLRTGSRSMLTGIVGGLATAGLVALMFWLALRTRRIVNTPLLIATAITAGLTYLSINPSALPTTYDQRVGETAETATALQEVYQARQAQHAVVLGLEDRWEEQSARAGAALDELGLPNLQEAWSQVGLAHEEAASESAVNPAEAAEAIVASQEDFDALETELRQRLSDQLAGTTSAVGRPATITSGAALLLGVIGAGLAWSGISQRLREYR